MDIEQALTEKDNLESALMAEIRKFETATGLLVDSIRLDRDRCIGERNPVLIRVESAVLLEGSSL